MVSLYGSTSSGGEKATVELMGTTKKPGGIDTANLDQEFGQVFPVGRC